MYKVRRSSRFKKDVKKFSHDSDKIEAMIDTIDLLQEGKELPGRYCEHALKGKYHGLKECHIQPDFLMVYEYRNGTIILDRLGSHGQLF